MILIGGSVESPESPAKFPPLRMSCLVKSLESQLVSILTNPFLAVLRGVIGRVLVMSQCHSIGLGIG